jgi:hypothetical protein
MIGELSNVSVAGMLRLLSAYAQTGSLKVSGADGEGEIYLEKGRIVGTKTKRKDIVDEVLRLLSLQQGFFHFEAQESIAKTNHQGEVEDVENLILEASRRCPAATLADFLPAGEAVLQMAPIFSERARLRLELQREEWNFLTKVNGEDSLEMLLEKSELPRERAVQVAYGLLSAGLLRKNRFRIPELVEIATRELGNMGEALVRQAFKKLNINQGRMHMKDLIAVLNELERNITLLLGPTRATTIIGQMWEGAKR